MKRLLASLITLISLCLPASVAAIPNPTSGIAVSPAIKQINLQANQPSATFNITVTNNNPSPITVSVLTSDFSSLNNTGSVAFLNKPLPAHGLKRWLSPGLNQIVLSAHGSQTIPVSITNVAALAPGGHYGAVIFKVLPSITPSGNSLSTNEELSVLVFLTTASGGTESIRLNQPGLRSFITSLPENLNLDFTNTGNVQVSPIGQVKVTDSSNKVLASGRINVDSGLVLPGTDRLYTINLNYSKQPFWPSNYHINVYYQASASSSHLSYTKTVFLINTTLIIVLGILILGLVLVVIRIIGRKNLNVQVLR